MQSEYTTPCHPIPLHCIPLSSLFQTLNALTAPILLLWLSTPIPNIKWNLNCYSVPWNFPPVILWSGARHIQLLHMATSSISSPYGDLPSSLKSNLCLLSVATHSLFRFLGFLCKWALHKPITVDHSLSCFSLPLDLPQISLKSNLVFPVCQHMPRIVTAAYLGSFPLPLHTQTLDIGPPPPFPKLTTMKSKIFCSSPPLLFPPFLSFQLRIEPRASLMLDRCSATEHIPSLDIVFIVL